jgi:hypothetical protein
MALTLTLLKVDSGPGGPWANVTAQVIPSGNYPAGGDVADLSTLWSQVDPTGKTIDSDVLPTDGYAESLAGLAGNNQNNYKFRMFTNTNDGVAAKPLTPKTCVIQFFKGTTEESAGAYENVFLSDYIILGFTVLSRR